MATFDSDTLDYSYERLVISNGMEVTGRIHRICEILTLAECCARAPVEHVARAPRDRQRPHPIGFATWLSNHRPFGLEWPEPERGSPARAFFAPSSRPNGFAASVEATGQRMHGSRPARRQPCRQPWSGKAMFLNALVNDDAAKSIISVRPKTGDFAVVRCRRRVFSRRILRRVGIFSKKSSPSRAEKAASRDVGGLRATPKRPTSRVGYQNRNRPRLRGHQTSSTASTRFASQTLSFLTLQ